MVDKVCPHAYELWFVSLRPLALSEAPGVQHSFLIKSCLMAWIILLGTCGTHSAFEAAYDCALGFLFEEGEQRATSEITIWDLGWLVLTFAADFPFAVSFREYAIAKQFFLIPLWFGVQPPRS